LKRAAHAFIDVMPPLVLLLPHLIWPLSNLTDVMPPLVLPLPPLAMALPNSRKVLPAFAKALPNSPEELHALERVLPPSLWVLPLLLGLKPPAEKCCSTRPAGNSTGFQVAFLAEGGHGLESPVTFTN